MQNMNYNIFFTAYILIVLLFWGYLVFLKKQKRITRYSLLLWSVAGANPIGMILFFCFKNNLE